MSSSIDPLMALFAADHKKPPRPIRVFPARDEFGRCVMFDGGVTYKWYCKCCDRVSKHSYPNSEVAYAWGLDHIDKWNRGQTSGVASPGHVHVVITGKYAS